MRRRLLAMPEIRTAREVGIHGVAEIVGFLFGPWPHWSDGSTCKNW